MNTANGAILLLISAIGLGNVMAGEVIYFLMGPISESKPKVSVVIPVSKPEDIKHARDLIINPPRDGKPNRYQAVLRIRGGKNGINRNYLDPKLPEWSWYIEEVLGFGDITAEGIQTTPNYLETRFDGSQDDGTATSDWAFPSYSIARELGPYPMYLSIVPDGEQLEFYWSGLGTNAVYTLEAKDTLTGTDWSPVSGASWPLETNQWVLGTDADIRCYRVRAEPQEATQGPEESLSFRTLDHGAFSGLTEATNLVIRTEAGWRDLWEKHSGLGVPVKAVPEVDFEKEMVVAVFTGLRGTSGYEVEVKRIVITSSRLRVLVERTTPAPDDLVLTVLTAPFHFVAVGRSELKPEFVGVEVE